MQVARRLVFLGSIVALTVPLVHVRADAPTSAETFSSLGWPWRGHLARSVQLPESSSMRYSPHTVASANHFGTPELVGALSRAASRVSATAPLATLTVGELSAQGGGEIHGHRSHENGRDVDVAFYVRSAAGVPLRRDRFEDVGRSGQVLVRGEPEADVHFDDARNWDFIEALLRDPKARVQYVFVGRWLRARLLAEAASRHVSPLLLEAAAHTLLEPVDGDPHRDHFHVRVFCADRDRTPDTAGRPRCRDKAPFWPWLPGLGPPPFSMRDRAAALATTFD